MWNTKDEGSGGKCVVGSLCLIVFDWNRVMVEETSPSQRTFGCNRTQNWSRLPFLCTFTITSSQPDISHVTVSDISSREPDYCSSPSFAPALAIPPRRKAQASHLPTKKACCLSSRPQFKFKFLLSSLPIPLIFAHRFPPSNGAQLLSSTRSFTYSTACFLISSSAVTDSTKKTQRS